MSKLHQNGRENQFINQIILLNCVMFKALFYTSCESNAKKIWYQDPVNVLQNPSKCLGKPINQDNQSIGNCARLKAHFMRIKCKANLMTKLCSPRWVFCRLYSCKLFVVNLWRQVWTGLKAIIHFRNRNKKKVHRFTNNFQGL